MAERVVLTPRYAPKSLIVRATLGRIDPQRPVRLFAPGGGVDDHIGYDWRSIEIVPAERIGYRA